VGNTGSDEGAFRVLPGDCERAPAVDNEDIDTDETGEAEGAEDDIVETVESDESKGAADSTGPGSLDEAKDGAVDVVVGNGAVARPICSVCSSVLSVCFV